MPHLSLKNTPNITLLRGSDIKQQIYQIKLTIMYYISTRLILIVIHQENYVPTNLLMFSMRLSTLSSQTNLIYFHFR